MSYRIVLAGGGTGGHIYPAIAIANQLKEDNPDCQILFIGSDYGVECMVVPEFGFDYKTISAKGWDYADGIFGKIKELCSGAAATTKGFLQSRGIIKKFSPHMVIGTGGFVSLPVLMAAKSLGIPYAIQEQNSYPGRTNRLMSKDASLIFLGIPGAEDVFDMPEKTIFTGNPIRKVYYEIQKDEAKERLNLPKDKKIVFSIGGSIGSPEINSVGYAYMNRVRDRDDIIFLFAAGKWQIEEVTKKMEEDGISVPDNVRLLTYIDDMWDYYAASDLVISRAGAMSLAELATIGTPTILIPLSWAINNHQYFNAKSLADVGGAIIVDEKTMDVEKIAEQIDLLLEKEDELASMRNALKGWSSYGIASENICKEIYKLIEKKNNR